MNWRAPRALLTDQLGTLDLRGFGADVLPLAIGAAGALLQYVRDTQRTALPHIRALQVEESGEALSIDAATRRNLELDSSLTGNEAATLLAVLDTTVTGMGARALRRWLGRPIDNRLVLRQRYQAVGALAAIARLRTAAGTAARDRRSRARAGARRAAQRAPARSGAAAQRAGEPPAAARGARASSTHRSCDACMPTRPTTTPSASCWPRRSPKNPPHSCATAM